MRKTSKKVIEQFLGVNLPGEWDTCEVSKGTMSQFLGTVPSYDFHDGSMGVSEDWEGYFAILRSGKILSSEDEGSVSSNYAHSETVRRVAAPLGRQWAESLGEIRAVLHIALTISNWSGQEQKDEREVFLTLIQAEDLERVKKIRRRVEDHLRKSSSTEVLAVAGLLGVSVE